jgi:hypothetical protein
MIRKNEKSLIHENVFCKIIFDLSIKYFQYPGISNIIKFPIKNPLDYRKKKVYKQISILRLQLNKKAIIQE